MTDEQHPDPIDVEAATIDARSPESAEQIEELIDESLEQAAVDAGGKRVDAEDVEGPNPA